MARKFEVKIASHPEIVTNDEVPTVEWGSTGEPPVCRGSGHWSSENIHNSKNSGTNTMDFEYSAECPVCRQMVKSVKTRERLVLFRFSSVS